MPLQDPQHSPSQSVAMLTQGAPQKICSPSNPNKTYTFVSLLGTMIRQRPRRRYDKIKHLYPCSWPDCTKSYRTLNHLNTYIMMQKTWTKEVLPIQSLHSRASPSTLSHWLTSQGLRPESFAQARLEQHLSWRNLDARRRDARKVRWGQRSGNRACGSGDSGLLSWGCSLGAVSFVDVTGMLAISGSFQRTTSMQ